MTLYLSGTGWLPWRQARPLLEGCHCLWIDLGGAQHGPAPADQPIGATHLWGWTDERWLRLRIEPDAVAAAVLDTEPGEDSGPVAAYRQAGLPWGSYGRTAPWHHPITLLVLDTPVPITFVAALEEAPPGLG